MVEISGTVQLSWSERIYSSGYLVQVPIRSELILTETGSDALNP